MIFSSSFLKHIANILMLAIVYFLAGRLGLLLAIPPGYATAIFPSSGIALAALLLFGNRLWLGVLLGSFILNLSMSPQMTSILSTNGLVAISIAIGATLQTLLAAFLIRRYAGFPNELADERDILKFFMLGGPLSCLVSSIVGTTTLFLVGAVTAEGYIFNGWNWWVGDVIGVFIATPLVLIALAKPRALWKQRITSVALPLLLCMAVVIIIFIRASIWENQNQQLDFKKSTQTVTEALQENIRNYSTLLNANERLFTATGRVTRTQFKTFVAEIINDNTSIQALSWLPAISHAERAHLEQQVQADGYANFKIRARDPGNQLITAPPADEYIPVIYIEPYKGNENALGYDLASNPARLQALQQARDTGKPVATGRIKLVQDNGDQYGFLVILPVYNSLSIPENAAARQQQIRGYVSIVLRVGDMLGQRAKELDSQSITMRVIDESAETGQEVLFQSSSWNKRLRGTLIEQHSNLDVGGRKWRIEFLPLPDYLVIHRAWQAWTTLAGGLLFTGLLGALLLLITGQTGKIQKIVDERTNELRIILDNVLDGIIQSFNLSIMQPKPYWVIKPEKS